jgi:hypothetical protein
MWTRAAAESAFRRQASPFDEVSAAKARSYLKIQNGFKYLSSSLCLKFS